MKIGAPVARKLRFLLYMIKICHVHSQLLYGSMCSIRVGLASGKAPPNYLGFQEIWNTGSSNGVSCTVKGGKNADSNLSADCRGNGIV